MYRAIDVVLDAAVEKLGRVTIPERGAYGEKRRVTQARRRPLGRVQPR
jgi:hypothetical protein